MALLGDVELPQVCLAKWPASPLALVSLVRRSLKAALWGRALYRSRWFAECESSRTLCNTSYLGLSCVTRAYLKFEPIWQQGKFRVTFAIALGEEWLK